MVINVRPQTKCFLLNRGSSVVGSKGRQAMQRIWGCPSQYGWAKLEIEKIKIKNMDFFPLVNYLRKIRFFTQKCGTRTFSPFYKKILLMATWRMAFEHVSLASGGLSPSLVNFKCTVCFE